MTKVCFVVEVVLLHSLLSLFNFLIKLAVY